MSERFVVLDTETTGLDPRRDRIITIGAVAVQNEEIRLDDSFEAMLEIDYNRGSVTVHGITRDEASGGLAERDAIEKFLAYLRDSVIVGHHIGHDVEALNCASERHFGSRMPNRWLDTNDLMQRLGKESSGHSLDALCADFGIVPHDRHTAGGDAFLTAQIFLRMLRIARKSKVTVYDP
jgi:DNA polymerase-3 subunit epsilon